MQRKASLAHRLYPVAVNAQPASYTDHHSGFDHLDDSCQLAPYPPGLSSQFAPGHPDANTKNRSGRLMAFSQSNPLLSQNRPLPLTMREHCSAFGDSDALSDKNSNFLESICRSLWLMSENMKSSNDRFAQVLSLLDGTGQKLTAGPSGEALGCSETNCRNNREKREEMHIQKLDALVDRMARTIEENDGKKCVCNGSCKRPAGESPFTPPPSQEASPVQAPSKKQIHVDCTFSCHSGAAASLSVFREEEMSPRL